MYGMVYIGLYRRASASVDGHASCPCFRCPHHLYVLYMYNSLRGILQNLPSHLVCFMKLAEVAS
jgi:hypothetical protein